jgi:tetratricopeptide (TPR) repeat protein
MSNNAQARCLEVDRRGFITGMTILTTSSIAGCGDSTTTTQKKETSISKVTDSTGQRETLPDEIQGPKEDIETVFRQLSEFPIFEKDEFVFDVTYFEDEFEHQSMRNKAERAIKRLERPSVRSVSESLTEGLINTAEIGKFQVAQRVMIHQIIAGSLALEKRIFQGEYDRALEVTRDEKEFLENLRMTGKQIEERLPQAKRLDITVEGFDSSVSENSQEQLVEIVRWADLAYEALSHAVLGFKRFEEGNAALETERYDAAGASYGEAKQRFEAAATAFDEAQGTGRRIRYIAPLVDGIRCLLPAYLTSCDRLQDSMEKFDAGNDERAKEIAREAISTADEKALRCF